MGSPALPPLSFGMAPHWRYAVAVSAALAMCCIVTIQLNDEGIRAEVAAAAEHDGMLYEHDDADSDDLSPAEEALINAARSRPDIAPPVQQHKAVAAKHSNHEETDEDQLSPAEQALIGAASAHSGAPAAHSARPAQTGAKTPVAVSKKPTEELSTVSESRHKHVIGSDEDELSEEEKQLISAASHEERRKQPVERDDASKATEQNTGQATEQPIVKHDDTATSSNDPDDLSQEEKALIMAARSEPSNHVSATSQAKTTKKVVKSKMRNEKKRVLKAQVNKLFESSGLKSHKQSVRPQIVKHHEEKRTSDGDSDDLSPEEKALIAAARSKDRSKADSSHETTKSKHHSLMKSRQRLQKVETEFTPAEQQLIHSDAPVVVESGKNMMQQIEVPKSKLPVTAKKGAKVDRKSMKKAMEKITKSAARQAVMAQTQAMKINVPAAESVLGITSPRSRPHTTAHPEMDARSVILGATNAAAEKKIDAHAFAAPAPSDSVPLPTVSSTVEDTRAQETKRLQQNLQHVKVQDTWEARLAAADRHAQMMAAHQALPLSPDEIPRAHMMRSRLAAEEKAIAGADYIDPEEASLVDARTAIAPP